MCVTVLTSSNYSAISSVVPTQVYRTKTEREGRVQAAVNSNNYDSVTLSTSSQSSRFHMSLVSRLSQEVRTATTTGDIANLRQQVLSGTYTPDPMAIAGRILFLGEGQ